MSIAETAPLPPSPAVAERPAIPMAPRTRAALAVMAAALGLGVMGDLLLRDVPWGLNVALWVAETGGAALLLRRWTGAGREAVAWVPWALGVALLLAWRDSPTLKGLDLCLLAAVAGLATLRARGVDVARGGLVAYAAGAFAAAFDAAFGAASLVGGDVRWRELPRDGWSRHAGAVARGLVIAVPLLVVFSLLLVSADAVFGRLLGSVLVFDPAAALSHVLLAGLIAWGAAGMLRGLLLEGMAVAPATRLGAGSLGPVEVGMTLGLVNLLFAVFVGVQVTWFFGGAGVVAGTADLGYADYARRGFFELVAVAGLVLPMLLALHHAYRAETRGQVRLLRLLSAGTLALLGVIMASAMRRMWLYQEAYGLTELRLYTSAFMGWLAVVSAWFALTVLRGRAERFAIGALASGAAIAVGLHAANPDGTIVRVNVARAAEGRPFDARYAVRLSGDAVPQLLAALPSLEPGARCVAARGLQERWARVNETEDWMSWSWSRARAASAVDAAAADLRAACAGVPAPPAADVAAAAIAARARRTAVAMRAAGTVEATALLPDGIAVSVRRTPAPGVREEHFRELVVMRGDRPLARHHLMVDDGGRSRAALFRIDAETLVLRDAFLDYRVNLRTAAVERVEPGSAMPGAALGAFDAGPDGEWRFVTAASRP